jgi:hypothetical protein
VLACRRRAQREEPCVQSRPPAAACTSTLLSSVSLSTYAPTLTHTCTSYTAGGGITGFNERFVLSVAFSPDSHQLQSIFSHLPRCCRATSPKFAGGGFGAQGALCAERCVQPRPAATSCTTTLSSLATDAVYLFRPAAHKLCTLPCFAAYIVGGRFGAQGALCAERCV